MALETVRSVCPHDCPDTCAMISTVHDGEVVRVAGDRDHPITRGYLCTKARFYVPRITHPERLLYPLARVGEKGEGRFKRISWEEALREIAARFTRIIAESGGEAILPYSYSGTLGLVHNYGMDRRFFHRLGASNLLRTICTSAGEVGQRYTMGSVAGPDPEGIGEAQLIVLWGSNAVSTGPHLLPMIKEARRRGAPVVCIDPRPTRSTALADHHIAIRPGTDACFALGVMKILVDENLVDWDFLARGTIGFEALAEHLQAYTLDVVGSETGVPIETLLWFARLYGERRRSFIRLGWGMQRYSNGGMAVRTLSCLPALTGAWQFPGGGLLLSNMDAFPVNLGLLQRPDLAPGLVRSVNMVELGRALTELDTPPIRALYVYNSNPAAVAPDQQRVLAGLRRPDLFTVVHELFQTDTADYADLILPATTQFEQTDLHVSMGYYLHLNRPATKPKGEARSNHDTFVALAAALGFTDPALFESQEDVARQAFQDLPDWSHVNWEQLCESGWARVRTPQVPHLPFANGSCRTPSGKIELYSARMLADGFPPLPTYAPPEESARGQPELAARYPLSLLSPASHVQTSSSHALEAALLPGERPWLEIHPLDADARCLQDGDTVRVWNDRGECHLIVKIQPKLQPGVVVTEKVRWPKLSPDRRNVNFTTSQRLADMGGGAIFHENLVEVAAVRSIERADTV
jgi:anaerobic selenocysteine-containing dehydrogenase